MILMGAGGAEKNGAMPEPVVSVSIARIRYLNCAMPLSRYCPYFSMMCVVARARQTKQPLKI